MDIQPYILTIVLLPLFGAIVAGLWGKTIGRAGAHWVTCVCMGLTLLMSLYVFKLMVIDGNPTYNGNVYTWAVSGSFSFNIGFLIDRLTALMLVVVNFVSFWVHIYSVGYMREDKGYQRFFSYISLFTFAMIMLVTANNFFQLFFGWEGVGLVSYLLIGFWFNKETANFGSLKAFIVNRVGDFGFILAIAAILTYFNTVDYAGVFQQAPLLAKMHPEMITMICLLLFVGAMGKSAQMPLHIWLPESMEGPTPISALIHAATMVTAGVFMVARMSPMFELSTTALSVVLIIGATSALFTGIVGVVQTDIKRVVAYSTLSQLGYMIAALGASAFAAGVFHLLTHAMFKALLFLSAGSVIMAMHHDQDMRNMGGLRKYMPITYICFLIGALALSAIPPFSGFYSKDAIIEAVGVSNVAGAGVAYWFLVCGAFVTALYIFRAFFLTFHTKEKMSEKVRSNLREQGIVVWLPLVALAIPATVIGAILAWPMLYAKHGMLGNSIEVFKQNDVLAKLAPDYHSWFHFAWHAVFTLPFWFAISGIVTAWLACVKYPQITTFMTTKVRWLYVPIVKKYGFDDFNQIFFVRGTRWVANKFYKVLDTEIIDSGLVNGSGRLVVWCSNALKRAQSGYLYHYAFAMMIGLVGFAVWMMIAY
tara:strand:- start:37503 stop:39446 length:1944 start_codon:yes stop_codon:yes gene_type:complete